MIGWKGADLIFHGGLGDWWKEPIGDCWLANAVECMCQAVNFVGADGGVNNWGGADEVSRGADIRCHCSDSWG